VGIDLDAVTQQLEDEGVQKFIKPFDLLLSTLQEKRATAQIELLQEYTLDRSRSDSGCG
jgi:hypothetical protein